MDTLLDVHNQVIRNVIRNQCFSKAGLAEGTNANTIKTAAPNGAGIDYSVNGVLYHKADTDNIAMTACAAQADLSTCYYLITINAAGTVVITKGTEKLTDGGVFTADDLPAQPDDSCVIGLMKIVTSGGTFTSGTTDLSGTGVTDTFYDLACYPTSLPG